MWQFDSLRRIEEARLPERCVCWGCIMHVDAESVLARGRLLAAASMLIFFCCASASAQQTISTPILESDANFRDLAGISRIYGGTGLVNPTTHDGVMRTGVFYRSEALTGLSDADKMTLSGLGLGLVVDLRTPAEIDGPRSVMAPNAGNDWVPAGAAHTNINIFGTPDTPVAPPPSAGKDGAINYMKSLYTGFVSDSLERRNIHDVLIVLANEPLSALFHCSAGKDRTGWTAVLLQSIAGVSTTTIMNDYLATNLYMAAQNEQLLKSVAPADQDFYRLLLGVRREYLQAGLDEVIARFGSLDDYLIYGLGLSRADIYVLRAKMVYYQSLPGQSGFVGNAAAGAAFLNGLQNSPLSGHYTSYNYYLQSAIDAGTLGGVQNQIGGQVHADTASYLSRLAFWVDGATAPYVNGRDLGVGQSRVWLAGIGSYFESDGGGRAASSTERSAGSVVGATYRIDAHSSAYFGVGYISGTVGSADASATVDTAMATFGGRYGVFGLETGPFVAARMNVGHVDYQSKRILGGGLGIAQASSGGAVYNGRVDLGNVIRISSFTVTPQVGLRVGEAGLRGFRESGSELALSLSRLSQSSSSVLADLDLSLDPHQFRDWTVIPSIAVGSELALGDPRAQSVGALYGYNVSQVSAYDSRYLMKAGLAVTAQRGAFVVKGGISAVRGDKAGAGLSAQASVGYSF